MPYQIGGVDIRTLAETAATSDPREATGFTTSKYLYNGYTHQDWFGQKMIMNYGGYNYSKECGIGSKFLRSGSAYFSVAARGFRPCPTYGRRRWDSSTPNTYYVNKFSDGEVWVSTTFNSRTGTRISTAAENIQYVFTMIIGPGGGGGGGSGTANAGGGGGGAFAFLCHRLVAGWVYRIYIGAGSSGGGANTNGSGSDNCQSAMFTDINNLGSSGVTMVNAMGGGGGRSGGNSGTGGGGGSISTYTSNSTYIQRLDERTGMSGGNKGSGGGTSPNYDTQVYTPEGHRLNYGQGAGGTGNAGGGGGGGWFFGHGGGKGGNGYAALFY